MSMIPHPVVSILVTILWMVLTGFSTGQLVLGVLVGLIAGVGWLYAEHRRLRRRAADLPAERPEDVPPA